jgi:hypothetical protein
MYHHLTTSVLETTNIYVKKNIVENNIKNIQNYIKSFNYQYLPFEVKKETEKVLQYQNSLLVKTKNDIKIREQLNFRFGSTL